MTFMPNQDTPIVLQPSKESLNLPPTLVSSQWTPILGSRLLAVSPVRCNHLDTSSMQTVIEGITIVGPIANQPFRQFRYKQGVQRCFDQRDFMRRSTANGYGERKTSAVCHCHDLRTFAPLGLSHPCAPFLAMTNVPSIKHSLRSSPPRSRRSVARVIRICSNIPERTHSWNRRWQVWYDGYRSGMSRHGAPVRITHRMPLRISRSSIRGLPRPSGRRGGTGISGSTTCHCSSVRSIGSASLFALRPILHHF